MYKHKYKIILLFFVPMIAGALSQAPFGGVSSLLDSFLNILNKTIPVIFGLALVFFFWGMAQFILHSSEEKARKDGKQQMIWGIIALFVIISIYGILKFVGDTLGIETHINTSSNSIENTTCPGGGLLGPSGFCENN